MKIIIELPEDEIVEAVKERIVFNAVREIEESMNFSKSSRYRVVYADAITNGVRQLIKKNIDSLSDRAVEAASVTIANKGIKKLMAQLAEESANGSAE